MPRTTDAAPPRSHYDWPESPSAQASASAGGYDHAEPLSFPQPPVRHDLSSTPAPSASLPSGAFAEDRLFPDSGSPRLYTPEASTSAQPWTQHSTPWRLSHEPNDAGAHDPDHDPPTLLTELFGKPTMPLFSTLAAMLSPISAYTPQQLPASPDRCFCGAAADEDSIYCGAVCGRKDAMQALCAEGDSKSAASGSHYRRVEIEEAKREKERERARERDKSGATSRMGTWRFGAGAGASPAPSPSPSPTPSFQSSTSSERLSRTPSPRAASRSESTSSHASVPSLSNSSVASYATSDDSSLSSPTSPHFFPSTPPQSHGFLGAADIYDSYLATPTPRANASTLPTSPFKKLALGPQLGYGLEEERDEVASGIGYGGQQLKERVKGRMARGQGHQKGKLSFEDVVGIMNA